MCLPCQQTGMRSLVLMKSMYFRWQKPKSIRLILTIPTPVGMICSPVITMERETGLTVVHQRNVASGESGSIGVTIGSTTETISVDDTTTLAGLASSIDALDGVSAYIVQIGTEAAVGSDGYQLFVQADTAGQFQGGDRFFHWTFQTYLTMVGQTLLRPMSKRY